MSNFEMWVKLNNYKGPFHSDGRDDTSVKDSNDVYVSLGVCYSRSAVTVMVELLNNAWFALARTLDCTDGIELAEPEPPEPVEDYPAS